MVACISDRNSLLQSHDGNAGLVQMEFRVLGLNHENSYQLALEMLLLVCGILKNLALQILENPNIWRNPNAQNKIALNLETKHAFSIA